MEESKEKEKGICQERRDMISNLPDSLISQMLSCLPTKEAVRTSVLSNMWKSLWLLIPSMSLTSYDFPDYNAFVSFVDKSLEEKACFLHKLELLIQKDNDNDEHCVTRWVDSVARRSKVKHLDVECVLVKREFLEVMPLNLYTCESLIYLRLHRVMLLGGFDYVSLPRLKTMRLEQNVYANEASLQSLIFSCLVLQDLSILQDDNVKVLRVHSQTLTSLTLGFELCDNRMMFYYFGREILELFLDSPRLKHLNFNDDVSKCQILSNLMSPSVKVNLGGIRYMTYYSDGIGFSNQQIARNFFTCIARARDLVISETIMKLNYSCLKVEPLPQFRARLVLFGSKSLFSRRGNVANAS
uniref:FBD-associated F-box protein n=1 Tax=Noccaea caerulescens TaxID=107243 RepID=A0A1J3I4L3_NOCCA